MKSPALTLPKTPTGIHGLDEITGGGLPTGRPTLVCGSAGAGKTVLAIEFLARGATEFNEPGVYMTFEESTADLTANARSFGFDLARLVSQKKILLDYVHVERTEIQETGEYEQEGLFVRIAHAVDSIGAKRVVLDTIEALFAGLPNQAVLRAELRRLFRWLKARELTTIITGEPGRKTLTRYGLEEYVADCVLVLDHRVSDQIATRRLRIVKYRGSLHGTNEYPFVISGSGILLLPITSLQLEHQAPQQRVPTGVPGLDAMLSGSGLFRGSSVLISGGPGTGKSSIAATFAAAACKRGERVLFFAYEESALQIMRNMRSIGIDLALPVRQRRLTIHASRPTLYGLEEHLVLIYSMLRQLRPSVLVVDPISNLAEQTHRPDVKLAMMRLIDFIKEQQITALFTALTSAGPLAAEDTGLNVSSLIDTWLLLRNVETNGERNRTLFVIKSRGMEHSNQVRELVLSSRGIDLLPAYVGSDRVLTGTARVVQEAQENAAVMLRQLEHDRRLGQLASKAQVIEAQIAALAAERDADAAEAEFTRKREKLVAASANQQTREMARLRGHSTHGNGQAREMTSRRA